MEADFSLRFFLIFYILFLHSNILGELMKHCSSPLSPLIGKNRTPQSQINPEPYNWYQCSNQLKPTAVQIVSSAWLSAKTETNKTQTITFCDLMWKTTI